MNSDKLVAEMIKKAAEEANIDVEQSKTCLLTAFSFIEAQAKKYGGVDLSPIGLPGAYARANTVPIHSFIM